jgi:hypothetical protein
MRAPGTALGDECATFGRRRRVGRAGDHQRRHGDLRDLLPEIGVAHRLAAGDIAFGQRGEQSAPDLAHARRRGAAEGFAEEAFDRHVGDPRQPLFGDGGDTLLPGLARRYVRGRRGEHEAVEPRRLVEGEPLAGQSAHGYAAEREPLEPQMIGERQNVEAEPLDGVGSGRGIAGAVAALVIANDPEGMNEGLGLRLPHHVVCAEGIGQDDRRGVLRPLQPIEQPCPVVCRHERHRLPPAAMRRHTTCLRLG